MSAKVSAAFVKAQASNGTPEGRMVEAALIRRMLQPANGFRCNQATPLIERFKQRLVFGSSDCWYWAGHVDGVGYGRITGFGENKAHRVSYRLFNGEIPDGMKVMHRCDTRCCVNPDHLFLGTQADNVRDMVNKGRNRNIPLAGELNPMAKASIETVNAIRKAAANGEKQITLAGRYGLSPMTISRIVRRESWN